MSEQAVVLTGDEVLLAMTAVRRYLTKTRHNYRKNLRHEGREHYAETELRRFDDLLDLYEHLGGNADDVTDPEGAGDE